MSVQVILSFRKCDKSHIQAFHVFFWASFSSYPVLIWRTWEQLTHHLVSHNSLSFHNQRKKTKLKVVLGETFFLSPWQAEKKLDIFNILRNSGKDKRKRDAKACQKKVQWKMVKNRQKTKTSLIPCVWNFLELLAVHKRTVQPCNFHPSFGTHKNPRIRAKSQKLLQMAWSSFWQREKRFFDYSHAIPNFSILHSPFIFNFSAP